jgi:hypothetical protein
MWAAEATTTTDNSNIQQKKNREHSCATFVMLTISVSLHVLLKIDVEVLQQLQKHQQQLKEFV